MSKKKPNIEQRDPQGENGKHGRIFNRFNYAGPFGEVIKGNSRTIPDQALSIRTILERYSRGQALPNTREPQYTEDDLSQFDRMDKFEKLDLAKEIRENIENQKKSSPQKEEKKENAQSLAIAQKAPKSATKDVSDDSKEV